MSDFKINNKVVQANELIQQANWNMNTLPLKIFKTVVSCIDTDHPKKEVCIAKKELAEFLGVGKNYVYLKNQMKTLQRQIVDIKKGDDVISVSVLPKVTWKANDDMIICHFDEDIMPYLVELKGMFLQYDVGSLIGFESKYGVILYEYLLSRERQENATKLTNTKHEYYITIADLRRLTGTTDKYPRMESFQRKVLVAAENDINNSNVEFLMRWETVKNGRKIDGIRFKIRKRTSFKEVTFDNVVHSERLFDKI